MTRAEQHARTGKTTPRTKKVVELFSYGLGLYPKLGEKQPIATQPKHIFFKRR
jgi:hypothetical protein